MGCKVKHKKKYRVEGGGKAAAMNLLDERLARRLSEPREGFQGKGGRLTASQRT